MKWLLPDWLSKHRFVYSPEAPPVDRVTDIRNRLARLQADDPDVTIIVPAYNEETSLLNTLSSLADQQSRYRLELIVANNNSTDHTQTLLDACGARSILAMEQGVSAARQAAFEQAKGRFVLNADADCLYPPDWANALVSALQDPSVACAYTTYSFIPSPQNPRLALMLHEAAAGVVFGMRRRRGYECVNVMGFTYGFRKEDGLAVGGYKLSTARGSDDGWMAMKLQARGQLKRLTASNTRVWSSDRLLTKDGGVVNAFTGRLRREVRRLGWYLRPAALPVKPKSPTL